MRGISFWFFATATIAITIGMIWGIVMSATNDHSLAPAHGHLNLVGWVTMALFGLYYHNVPEAAAKGLAKIHFGVAAAGLMIIVPGIVMAVEGGDQTLAKVGSALTVASILIFLTTVLRHRSGVARQG